MKAANVPQNLSTMSTASHAASSSEQVDLSLPVNDASTSQLSGFGVSSFETDRRRSRSFEEARKNHVQLNGLMAKVRKPLPRMTQRMARAGLRAGSAGVRRGEYAYRNLFVPIDGKLYEMQVHPVKNLLEWNFTNLDSDHAWLPHSDAPWGFVGKCLPVDGQPWPTPPMQHRVDGHASRQASSH